jgi:hypothetical protein
MEQTKELSKETERLMSLDALRGFDMFWIIGAALYLKRLLMQFNYAT